MGLLGTRAIVAFDAGSVCAARVKRGWRRLEVDAFQAVPLAPGSLVPSPFGVNLRGRTEVREALAAASQGVVGDAESVTLLLPDGVAPYLLVEAPRGTRPQEVARFRLGRVTGLGNREARVGVLGLGWRRYVATLVARRVVEEYEAAVREAGRRPGLVSLAPLAGLVGLLSQGRPPSVGVVLGDAALLLGGWAGRQLKVLRGRRRDGSDGEPDWLIAEVERTLAQAGAARTASVRIVGPGAERLGQAFAAGGLRVEAGWADRASGAAAALERAWLGGCLA
jgi:hypothetical protein